jgi:MFS family permease
MATGNIAMGLFSAVQEQAKAELALSDFQLSLLSGLAVSIPLAILAVPVGLMVDRGNRVRLLLWTAMAWTIGTLITAVAESMPVLFVARMLGGVGASISTTIAISLASDLSLPANRGRSLLLLTVGKYAGTALAFALGGWLLGHFLAQGGWAGFSAWRSAHLAVGMLSLLLLMPLARLREPLRQETKAGVGRGITETLQELAAYRRFLAPLFLGQIGVMMADAAAAIWAAPVLSRTYGASPQDFGGWLGAVIFAAGVLGSLAGGFAADAGLRGGRQGGILAGAVFASVFALPAAFFPIAPDTAVFAALLFVLLLGGTITGLVTATTLAVLLPNDLRGLAIGVFLAIGGLVAFGIAPTLVTVASTTLGGEGQIGIGLAIVGFLASAMGCGGFVVARKRAPSPVR